MSDWRVAHALEQIRAQVNAARPNRRKSDDGTIGDANHANRTSDHNPYIIDGAMGVVTALDLTHDPAGGFDSYKYADILRIKADRRIKYIISNRRIAYPGKPWRYYDGANAHDRHCHLSVVGTKSLYDNIAPWDLGDLFADTAPDVPPPVDDEPVLRRGDSGPYVKALQQRLNITDDGYFGPNTEAAVTLFQRRRGLVVDGIVGGYTWRALKDQAENNEPINNPKMINIVATQFGGAGDPNKSAYDGHFITSSELCVALPYRFPGARPQVRVTNRANGLSVICSIQDVGPWNTADNYWLLPTGRPQAETGRDTRGRKTNLAGIDLSPAADNAIRLGGMGKVDWEFVPKAPDEEVHDG